MEKPKAEELPHPSVALWNTRHELFCQEVLKGKSAVAAYQEVYACALETAESSAYRVLANAGVPERLQWLKEEAAKKAMLSIEEIHKFLADVVRTPAGEVGKTSALCQEYEDTPEKTKVKMPGKLDAITLYGRLTGAFVEKQLITIDDRRNVPRDKRRELLAKAEAKRAPKQ